MTSTKRPWRIAVGLFQFEGNSQSPVITTLEDFQNIMLAQGEDVLDVVQGTQTELAGALELFSLFDVTPIPLIAANGIAGGRVDRATFDHIHAMLKESLANAGQLDAVYLALHGAFITEDENDLDGLILEDVRAIIGDIPLAVSLDLHGNITRKMAAIADVIIGYRHYPHDDTFDTGQRIAGLLMRMLKGEVRPVMRVCRTPMIVACQNQNTKGEAPLAEIHAMARGFEYTGTILAASYFPVQHGLDFPEMGYATVVVTDNDPEAADRIARFLAKAAWDRRHDFDVPVASPQDAIARGMATQGQPIVLSDASDTVGGGAAGDSAFMLKMLLEHAPNASSTMIIVDPESVSMARSHEIGEKFSVCLGNKHSPVYGPPLEVEATLVRIIEDCRFTYVGGCSGGVASLMGPTAVLQVGPVTVIVPSLPTYEHANEQFRAAGLNPDHFKFVVVKNPMNYQQAFPHAPALFDLDAPGPTTCQIRSPQWKLLDRPIYPLDDDFEPEFTTF